MARSDRPDRCYRWRIRKSPLSGRALTRLQGEAICQRSLGANHHRLHATATFVSKTQAKASCLPSCASPYSNQFRTQRPGAPGSGLASSPHRSSKPKLRLRSRLEFRLDHASVHRPCHDLGSLGNSQAPTGRSAWHEAPIVRPPRSLGRQV